MLYESSRLSILSIILLSIPPSICYGRGYGAALAYSAHHQNLNAKTLSSRPAEPIAAVSEPKGILKNRNYATLPKKGEQKVTFDLALDLSGKPMTLKNFRRYSPPSDFQKRIEARKDVVEVILADHLYMDPRQFRAFLPQVKRLNPIVLSLKESTIGLKGVQELAEFLPKSRLKALDLSRTGLDDQQLAILLPAIKKSPIERLVLDKSSPSWSSYRLSERPDLGIKTGNMIADALQGSRVKHFSLRGDPTFQFGEPGLTAMIKRLAEKDVRLESINLKGQLLGTDAEASRLVRALASSSNIGVIHIDAPGIRSFDRMMNGAGFKKRSESSWTLSKDSDSAVDVRSN